jgi:CRP-like cAMP-binding protein
LAVTPFPTKHALVRKLECIFTLADDERHALLNLPMQLTKLGPDQTIVREGHHLSRSCVLLEGFAYSYKATGYGKRQILAFNIPGDIVDLHGLHLEVLDNSVGTITPCTVGYIPHEVLRDLCGRYPRIAAALWRGTLVDAAIFREWLINVGRREASVRIAHLLCEMLVRLRAVGLAEGYSCDLPITQGQIADALGLTPVYVNRVLQALRADGLIDLTGNRLSVPDWDKLRKAGDFDPTYLHLERDHATA